MNKIRREQRECDCIQCHGTGTYIGPKGNKCLCWNCNGTGRKLVLFTVPIEDKSENNYDSNNDDLIIPDVLIDEENILFFNKYGFDSEGWTNVLVGDTRKIKDELKTVAKFDKNLYHWIMPVINTKYDYYKNKICVSQVYKANKSGHFKFSNPILDNKLVDELNAIDEAVEFSKIKIR